MRIFAKSVACVAVALSVGAGLSAQANAQCLADIKEKGVLVSAVGLMGTKPFVWKDAATNQYVGYEPEMLEYITKKLGIPKWDYEITEWTTMIPGLKAKRWDIIMSGMSVTQERVQGASIDFSDPYFMMYDHLVVLDDSDVKTIEDLKGKTLGAPIGTLDAVNAQLLVDAGKAGKLMTFNSFNEPFIALKNKQVDGVIVDNGTYAGIKDDVTGTRIVGESIPYNPKPEWVEAEKSAPYRFGVTSIGMRKECVDLKEAINKALADMDTDGSRKAILSKYGMWSDEQSKLMK